MDIIYLTPQEALRALADGKILENNDGVEVLLQGSNIMMRFTYGKRNSQFVDMYSDGFDGLFISQ